MQQSFLRAIFVIFMATFFQIAIATPAAQQHNPSSISLFKRAGQAPAAPGSCDAKVDAITPQSLMMAVAPMALNNLNLLSGKGLENLDVDSIINAVQATGKVFLDMIQSGNSTTQLPAALDALLGQLGLGDCVQAICQRIVDEVQNGVSGALDMIKGMATAYLSGKPMAAYLLQKF